MPWSQYQRDIFDFVADAASGSAIVEAVAGSGKTTTIVESLRHIPWSQDRALFLAFNKKIADELRDRVPDEVEAKTFNALGNAAVRSSIGSKMNPQKMSEWIKKNADDEVKKNAFGPLSSLIRLAKGSGIGVLTPNEPTYYHEIIDHHGLEIPEAYERQILQLARRAIDTSLRDQDEHDFDDQILWPVHFDLKMKQYDIIFVDEAQDLSPLQHEFLARILKPGGRLIAVGDTHQAIYGFRGADADSMNQLRRRFSTTELPLSITYRCPQRVTEKAQEFVPHIQWAEGAPEGEVSHLDSLPDLEDLTPDDLVLCRTNAPLLQLAMRLLRRQLPVYVMGNFGDNMIRFLKRFRSSDINDFWQELGDWYNRERADAEEKEQWNRLAHIEDKYESILNVGSGAQTPQHITDRFTKLFEPKRAVKLGTIHKGKGTEAERVYLVRPDLLPFKYATQDWQLEQEKNLEYVAVTRAKQAFYYADYTSAPE